MPPARRTPVSRRDRPAKPPLTREGIVAVAVRVLEQEGLERVTMRRLAQELDTGPASIYVYLSNSAELHGAVLDHLLTDFVLPSRPSARTWREQLVEVCCSYTEVLFTHPSLARSVLALRPTGPHFLRLVDGALALLHAGGVPTAQAAWGVDLLLLHATATAAEQGTREESGGADDQDDALALVLHEVPAEELPSIARAAEDLVSGSGPQRLRWAFAALVEGIATTGVPLADPSRTRAHQHPPETQP